MDLEAKRFAGYVQAYCQVNPHFGLGGKLNDLEAGELVAVYYLVAHERLPLDDAMTQFPQVTAIRMPRRPITHDGMATTPTTCGSLSEAFPRERIHLDGIEWAIMDNR
jgi:hypothetical protein